MNIFFLSLMYITTIFILLFLALYIYFTRNFSFWQKHKFPYEKPLPFLGNFKDVMLQKVDIGHHLKNIYNAHRDKPYVGIFSFDKPAILVRDLKLARDVLVRDSNEFFVDRILSMDERVDPLGAKNLFSLKGQKWRYIRGILTPSFTSVKMKKMFCIVNNCSLELVDFLVRSTADGSPTEVKDTMARFTTDVMASCAFGIDSNSLKDPNAEFRRVLRTVFQFSLQKALAGFTAFFAPALQSFLRLRLIDDKITTFVRNTVWSTAAYRQQNGVVRNDFLDSIIKLSQKNGVQKTGVGNVSSNGNEFSIDGDDFVAQAYIFLAAGFEPASTTLSFALYELSFQPEIQERLRAEIVEVTAKYNHEVTYDGIQEMTYLDMVVSETLRKYPPVPFLDRITSRDYRLLSAYGGEDVVLRAQTGVYIPVLAIHNDPDYYPEPHRFDPERFTEENKRSRPSYTYFPFGEGPRTCIGMRLGLLMVKSALAHVLSHYEVTPCKDTPIPLLFDPRPFLLAVEGDIPLLFNSIKNCSSMTT